MLGQKTKKVTITAISTTEIEGKKVVLENYTATVDSENPENMSMSKFFPTAEAGNCTRSIGQSAERITRRSKKMRTPSRTRCLLCSKNKR